MTTALFGKPESAGVVLNTDPMMLAHAEIVNRAIHTLELLGEWGIVKDDESTISLFVAQSWGDLTGLLEWYKAQGVRAKDIEL